MKHGTFDEMTRLLATSTSRRQALRQIAGMVFGGTVGGVALAELSPGVALASGGNSDCAHFCNAVFDPGPDRGKCKSDAAHGTGLCYTCGPASPGGSQQICCPTNADGTCTSYSSATCCTSGQTCTGGTCVAGCPAGQVMLCNGSCATPCSGLFTTCSGACGLGTCLQDGSGALYCSTFANIDQVCTNDCCPTQGYFCYFSATGQCYALC